MSRLLQRISSRFFFFWEQETIKWMWRKWKPAIQRFRGNLCLAPKMACWALFCVRMRPLYDSVSAVYVMSHVWMSHRAAYLCENESWGNIFAWGWGHSTTLLVLYMSCHMYEWVMAHMNESWVNIFARGLGHSKTPLVPYYFKEPTNRSHPIASICHVIHTHESWHLYHFFFANEATLRHR